MRLVAKAYCGLVELCSVEAVFRCSELYPIAISALCSVRSLQFEFAFHVPSERVQPARRLRTCAKAKKTYRGLDKESLAQSRVFPMERGRDVGLYRVQIATGLTDAFRSGRDGPKGRNQVATYRRATLRPSRRTDGPRQAEPAFGVTPGVRSRPVDLSCSDRDGS
ncbi:hypothetical protein Taro_021759 [Colocasia esculenta]|uniref:Uncharacterized protein n=1 Tax=Colocasia esculenta TaxID=4460 RepID=A0A843V237_COLES|nr:hypothetical protein [Colocasia esculenta]